MQITMTDRNPHQPRSARSRWMFGTAALSIAVMRKGGNQMRAGTVIALAILGCLCAGGCVVGTDADDESIEGEEVDLPYAYFTGTIAYAFRYSDDRYVGYGYVDSSRDGLQQSAFESGAAACGYRRSDAYASVSWYVDGTHVLHQQYHCGDL